MSAMLREPALLKQLKDMAETHAIELRAYEATVANLESRIRELEAERVPSLLVSGNDIRKLWRAAGGQFYGPITETGSMPESKLLPFLRELMAERVPEALPYWPPCNPGCDPEFNGCRSKGCATLCDPARKAMLAAAPQPKEGV